MMKEKSLRLRRALRLVLLFLLFTTIGMTKLQAHDFEVDNLLYTIIGTNPPTVSLDGHVDGTSASDELLIPETVEYDDVTYTVVAIGANAFADCTDMYGDIDIPNTVLTIGEHAFDGAGFDGNLILGEAVTTIGNYAFANLGSTGGDLIIPDAVTHIGTCAFYQSYFDGSFAMSDAIVSIGDSAFYNCPHVSISNLKLSNTLTEIGDYAFYYCTNMTGRLTLSTALTSVGAHAFQNCGFTQLNFGSTTGSQLQSIGDYAFAYCVNMTGNLAFPNSLQTVGQYAFYYCGFNNTLTLRNVQSIGECAFQSCSFSKNLTIPNTVTEIGPGAFYNAFTAGTLTINANINTIPNYAFASCHFTGTLTIPNSVVSIGSYAFSSCSGFTGELNIHENVISIGCGAFNGCSGFTRLNYNATNCSIISNGWDGYGWVENCTNLTDLYIAENVQTISDHAFEVAFSSINVLAQTPPTLGESVFSNVNTTPVYVPCGFEGAYTSINWGGFSYIYGLCSGTVTVLANPTEGGSVTGGGFFEAGTNCTVTATANTGYVFANWTKNGLSVSTDAEYTFPIAGDMILVANFVPDGNILFADANVKSICVEYWDTNSDGELSYLEAASVKTIGTRFDNNEDITSFEELQYFIGLTSISDFAFWSCYRLSTVVLPSTIRTIGNRAFLNSGLSVITVLSSTPPTLGENVFGYEPNSLVSVYVPCGSEQAYSTISWGDLSDFYGMCAGNVTVMANPTAGGSVTGGGNYEGGTTCTVTATANTGYVFANWMKNGKIASRNSEYTFFVAGDMELVANFVPDGNIAFADANVKSICISNWDTNGDGELSYAEAASVSSLVNEYYVNAFEDNDEIVSFDELQYFIGLASIGNSAFEDCHNLSSVILPNTVTTLGAAAFAYCENLVSIELPASLTVIGESVFYGCSSLTGSITIGEHVTMIGDNAFAYCSNITSLNFNAINSVITNEYGQHGWLYGCTGLHTLTIGDQVQTIPDYAFYRSDVNLTGELVIPASVTAIGEQAFANNSFTAIYSLPMTPPALGNNAFENISQSIPVYVPCNAVEAYEDISWGGFNTISGLCGGTVTAKVNPADAGTVTGGGVFEPNQTCTLVATANPGYIFANWAKNGVVVSMSAEYTFPVASDVTMVANFFPDANIVFVDANVKNICVEHWDTNGDGELSYLEAAAVTSLSDEFQYNSDIISFEELQYFVGLTSIKDQAFRDCSNLTSVVFPYSLTSIEERAFYGCSNLVSVVFPYSLTSIGYRAFRLCGLASIILPASLKSIGEEAFYSTIAEVYCMATTPPSLGDNAFYGVGQDIPVYVPCDAVEAYENVSWGGFNTFNGLCGGAVTVIAKPTEGGVVTGGGTIEADQYCVVTATANPGYMFVNWTKNDVIVSSNSEYTFLVANDMTLVATFVPDGNIAFADANVKSICVEYWDTNSDGELSYLEAASVKTIGTRFKYNSDIISFEELQYFVGLASIGNSAFEYCHNLSSVILPNTVTTLGAAAFAYCENLVSIELPASLTVIGESVFYGCSSLTGSITIGEHVTMIGDNAFAYCSNITSLNFNAINSVITNEYGEHGWLYGCTGLHTLTIGDQVQTIPDYAFYGSDVNLTGELVIPASVTSIGEQAFANNSFTAIYSLSMTPPALGDNAFENISQITPVFVPCNAVEAYENVSWGGFNAVNGLCGGEVTVVAKPTEGGVVTGGGTIGADQYCTVTATTNTGYMFVNWTKNDVIVSNNSEYTFLVANDMTLVANFMLEGNITFADANVKNICVEIWDTNGDGELSYMEAASVTSLEDYWGNSYFKNNTEITSFNELQYFIGLGEIYDNTFYRCTNLASISLPPYISYIGSRAFYECSSLTGNLVIPNTVQWIGLEAFSGCINLSGNLVLPVSLTTLEQDAFLDCSGFTGDLVIPNSLTTIAYGAFYGCSGLNGNLTIGESITSIGGMAFYNCSNIQSITVLPEEMPGLGSETFSGVSMDIPVYVPCDALADYQNSSWGGFTNFEGVCNCYRPTNLASAQIGATNALISWDGTSDSYVLQYRTAAQDMNMNVWHQIGDDIITTGALTSYTFDLSAYSGTGSIAIRHYNCSGMFKIAIDSIVVTNALDEEILNEGFEEGIPATWTNLDYDGDGYTWGLANFSGWTLGTYCLYSESYNGDAGDLTPDNWMIIPDVELGGTLTLYAKATDVNWADENFGVFVTTESYAAVPAGAWSSEISTTALSYQLTGLTANTPYEWRVKGICDSEESKWASSSFVTIAEGFKTFTTSGNWDVATNWFPEGVPTLADEISIEAAATIPTGVVAVAKRASVNGGGTLTIEDGGQLKQGAATLKVTVKKNVIGYGEANATDQDGYSMIAPPFGGTTQFYYDANWNHVLNLTSGTYDLYAFDASCVGQEWQNQESGAFTSMASGSGYLYANQDNKTLMFTGGAIGSTNNTITKPFEYDPTSTDPFNGFKLVGNPFTCEAYLSFAPAGADPQNVDFYVMNAKGDGFELGQTGVALNVCQGALFYSDASGDIVYSSEVPSSKGSGALNINLVENGQTADVARVRFGEGRRLAKAVFNDNSSKIYILQNNKDYAVVYSEDQGEMPVNFKAKNNGAYTLNFSNDEVTFSYLHLIDNKTGADIDLLETPSYTFDARTTDYVSRFKLVYAKGGSNTSDNFAFINNGNLMVLGIEGKATLQVIDVTGRIISNETFSGNYSKAINAKVGVYVLRLIQGNDVRTQKIVVR